MDIWLRFLDLESRLSVQAESAGLRQGLQATFLPRKPRSSRNARRRKYWNDSAADIHYSMSSEIKQRQWVQVDLVVEPGMAGVENSRPLLANIVWMCSALYLQKSVWADPSNSMCDLIRCIYWESAVLVALCIMIPWISNVVHYKKISTDNSCVCLCIHEPCVPVSYKLHLSMMLSVASILHALQEWHHAPHGAPHHR